MGHRAVVSRVALGVAFAFALAEGAVACLGTDEPVADGGADSGKKIGCGAPSHVAPNGYYTSGSTVCTAAGQPHLFHGVDRPSLEFLSAGDHLSQADFVAMASWNANVVRIALNQDFWLQNATLHDPSYQATVDQALAWAEAAGLDVILDLHWSDQGNLGVTTSGKKQNSSTDSNQQPMADANSITFWTEVATKYKGDGRVLFEMYNEPEDIAWSVWLAGGAASSFNAAGMQQMLDAIRGAGADNVVIAGGLHWAYDLSHVASQPLSGYNVMYATHPYDKGDNAPSTWEASFGYLATKDIAPVIATEFGDFSSSCSGAWDTQLIAFADAHEMSWTAWAWYPTGSPGCNFPSLIVDWNATPTVQGAVVKSALLGYPKNPNPTIDAGTDATTDAAPEADASDEDASAD